MIITEGSFRGVDYGNRDRIAAEKGWHNAESGQKFSSKKNRLYEQIN